ncbi:MAG: aspartyl/asparaginyl beta-hydroxylase domain-containing protein [Gammaproteobacteria bacterium]|nr:aspartyl/asparaginyl beta-hydroxylase domain-containing protein [Gammaproteobacteria bacterium]
MDIHFLAPKFDVLYVFALSAVYVHFRGRVRHRVWRQLTDHSTVMAPYNVLMYLFSAVPNTPYLDVQDFPGLAPLQANWQEIRDEAVRLAASEGIRAAATYNDLGFNSFFRTGWKRFYLKWYGEPLPSANTLCPRTVALVEAIPEVNAAMFALLPPGAKLVSHRDPFAGSLRYHLGLVTPNSEDCRIFVDGNPYHWRDGEAVMFDETYIHYAENRTDVPRVILFCDIERPLRSRAMAALNRVFKRVVMRASQTQNVEGEHVGFLNRLFAYVYRARLVGKRIKSRNKVVYYGLKYILIGGAFYLIFLW